MRRDLLEYEVYVDESGWAVDDEMNRWYVGPHWGEGTYFGRDADAIVRSGVRPRSSERPRSRPRAYNPRAAEQRAAITRALAYKPKNVFLLSVAQQLADGRVLSAKQREVVRKILIGLGGTESAKLFEEETMRDVFEDAQAALAEKRIGFVFPDRPSPVGTGKGAWPIGDKKHALIAISYMAAGKGDAGDYPAIKKAIKAKWGKDRAVMAALTGLGEAAGLDRHIVIVNLHRDYPVHSIVGKIEKAAK